MPADRIFMKTCSFLPKIAAAALCGFVSCGWSAELTHFVADSGVVTEAVRVKRGALVHTRQFLGLDAETGDLGVADMFGQLKGAARAYDSGLADVAKLNLYLAADDAELKNAVEAGLAENWPPGKRPAVAIAQTKLPGETKVACDAVIACDAKTEEVERFERDAAVLSAARDIVYVSGRAASGELAEATSGTMEQLFAVLEHLGSGRKDVVQVKAFIQPMTGWETVEAEIEKSFGAAGAPPVVYVEWTSKSRATEIELIAAAPDRARSTQSVSYFTPPGDKPSPVFSRVARVHGDEVVFIAGITAPSKAATPDEEVRGLYKELDRIARRSGSDLRHFAKATYYVSDGEVSAALNRLRPDYYDPKRPPAASKVQVPSVGVSGRGLLIDMVAAPVAQ